jgi:hypothetical protein
VRGGSLATVVRSSAVAEASRRALASMSVEFSSWSVQSGRSNGVADGSSLQRCIAQENAIDAKSTASRCGATSPSPRVSVTVTPASGWSSASVGAVYP